MPDFPNDPKPDYPIQETPANPEVLVSRHRDGSEQRRLKGAGDGPTFTLSFGGSCPVTKAQRDNLVNHYAASNGTLSAFNWTHPERTAETYLVRYAEPLSVSLVGYNAYQAHAKLKVVPA